MRGASRSSSKCCNLIAAALGLQILSARPLFIYYGRMIPRAGWFAALMVASCSVSEPARESSSGAHEPMLLVQPPSVTVIEFGEWGLSCTVTVSNTTASSLGYCGYGSRSIFYWRETWIEGEWNEKSDLWCGTGARWTWLQPGESVRLHLPFPMTRGPHRILGTFRDDSGRSTDVVLAVRPD
jgi:hypothetical protein